MTGAMITTPRISFNSSTFTSTPPARPGGNTSFDHDLDTLFGSTYCVCFILGVVGNITSFCYFITRKTDLPNTLYRIITTVDSVISVAVLPVAISLLSGRDPGNAGCTAIIRDDSSKLMEYPWNQSLRTAYNYSTSPLGLLFGNESICLVWTYVWHAASRLSIFLVVVLSCSRTYYLLKPFYKQRILPSVAIITVYCVFQVCQTIGFQVEQDASAMYYPRLARCAILFGGAHNKGTLLYMDVVRVVSFILPMFIVFFSSIVSIRVTLKKRDNYLRKGSGQTELRKSRNRATLTIILFALVYTVFNVPLVVTEILHTIDYHTNYMFDFHSFDYKAPYLLYYDNFVSMLSVSLNAAINPLLYLWRMPSAREFVIENSTPHKIKSRRDRQQRWNTLKKVRSPVSTATCGSWSIDGGARGSIQELDILGGTASRRSRLSICT